MKNPAKVAKNLRNTAIAILLVISAFLVCFCLAVGFGKLWWRVQGDIDEYSQRSPLAVAICFCLYSL